MKPFILLLLLAPLAHADHPLVEHATAQISDYANLCGVRDEIHFAATAQRLGKLDKLTPEQKTPAGVTNPHAK